MKILIFGHIPIWAGGRQQQGMANVIYNLALSMSHLEDVEICLAATDVFQLKKKVGKLTIYGWTKIVLLKFALLHPIIFSRLLLILLYNKCLTPNSVDVGRMLFKGIHLRRIINIQNPDIVHLHGANAIIYQSLVPKNVKIIFTIHGTVGNDPLIPYYKEIGKYEKRLCNSSRVSKIYFVTSSIINEFKDLYGAFIPSIEIILNAYNSEEFYYIPHKPHDNIRLCTIASIQDRKGQLRVIEAIRKSGIQDIEYNMIGTADAIENLNIDNHRFTYLGVMNPNEIRETLSNMDYMILPSSSEGFGLVFLESIACGVPVILPKQLPIVQEKYLIQPGVNAILLEDCSVDSILNILPTLRDNHFNSKEVSKTIMNYSWDTIAKQYILSFKTI